MRGWFFFLLSATAVLLSPSAWAIILNLNLNVSPVLSVGYDGGPFTLSFSNFLQGSLSDTHTVTYRIQANSANPGDFRAAVSAHLREPFRHAELQADVAGYRNLGPPGFATLAESQAGFKTVETAGTPLADKRSGQGAGTHCVDGEFTVVYRARLVSDSAEGTETASVVMTFYDGN